MEPNYKEEVLTGTETSWQRVGSVAIYNTYAGMPYLLLNEDIITALPSGKTVTDAGVRRLQVNFDTNNPLHVELYTVLNMIYIEERNKADNPVEVVNEL